MLLNLTIKNVALIDSANISFEKGLNVLSGETGAGKSIILDSLSFVLGARADKSFIRSGADEAMVKAVFDITNNNGVKDVLNEFDIELEEQLVISRKLSTEGKSNIKVNGNTITASMLKKLTSILVDIHGQSEHFSLLKNENQLKLIDDFFNPNIQIIKNNLYEKIEDYKKIQNELNSLGGDSVTRANRIDILNYQISEIENFDLKDGEEEELTNIKKVLQNSEKIANALSMVENSISGDRASYEILSSVAKQLQTISNLGENYDLLSQRLYAVLTELDDISSVSNDYLSEISNNGVDIDYVEDRLEGIKSLKRKYGNSYNEICSFLDNAIKERALLENFDENAEKLLKKKDILEKDIYNEYISLSKERQLNAHRFSDLIISELGELAINNAQFYVKFADLPDVNNCSFTNLNGIDQIEFMFSANLGEPAKSLSETISGGEISRFMLAIKVVTSKINNISTFIFDEIDSGISGQVAKVVAEKFAKISMDTQIIAISHLPQISAMADENLFIHKIEEGGKTITKIINLDKKDKIKEICRLIGGETFNQSAINHAEDLINYANKYKSALIN